VEAAAGLNAPHANLAEEPCSKCGRTDVLYSNRQIKIDAARRRCLTCMPNYGTVVPTEPTDKEAAAAARAASNEPPKPCIGDQPCSACGRMGCLFSKRQMKVDPLQRRCLDCMQNMGPGATMPGNPGAPPPPNTPPPIATLAAAATGGDPVKPSTAPEPCSGCGNIGALYSKRQIKVEPAQRKCLDCMMVKEQTNLANMMLAPPAAAVRPRSMPPPGARLALPFMPQARPLLPFAGRPPAPLVRPPMQRAALPMQFAGLPMQMQRAPLPMQRVPFVPRLSKMAQNLIRPPASAAPKPVAPLQGSDAPKPCAAPEPCSGCGRENALYSKRQFKVDPASRRCLECMSGPGAEAEALAQAAAAEEKGPAEANVPKAMPAPEPCSGCGRVGALFSKRQLKVDPSKRKCLDCMPAAGSAPTQQLAEQLVTQLTGSSLMATPIMPKKRKAAEAGIMPPDGATVALSRPAENLCEEPCSACGCMGVPFSNRQMKVDAKRRRCLGCMPTQRDVAGQPQDEVAAILASEAGMNPEQGLGVKPPIQPPKENIASEPCSQCGRLGAAFSNRQMKVDAAARKCLDCMAGGAWTATAGTCCA